MKKKINLENLQIASFITETDKESVKAGSKYKTDSPVCPTENTGCFVCPPYTTDCEEM
ncbi:pinensin family lanthipeptide [Roseivirga sp. BDSF3-8]|uniref:pinensin family lanthipeptide n=1 Tax=Roseivirga sp. BDSF3-8 TaxID=3241598 RepID=UPI003531B1A1